MGNEVLEFAEAIGAKDMKSDPNFSAYQALLRRQNYFVLGKNQFLVIKISRIERPFWGLRKKTVELFNALTKESGNYFLVALVSNKSGWVLSKSEIVIGISTKSISYSERTQEYKLIDLKDRQGFSSIETFFKKIGFSK